jgi:hypothetical protein
MLAAWTTTLSKNPCRIDQDMPFDAHQLLVPIKSPYAAHEGFDRLTIDNGGTGRRIPSGMQPGQLPQTGMNLDPGAIPTPLPKIIIDRLPGAVLAGQIAPGAASP